MWWARATEDTLQYEAFLWLQPRLQENMSQRIVAWNGRYETLLIYSTECAFYGDINIAIIGKANTFQGQ